MPNRILRDWTDSEAVNSLDANAERFFVRLIMKADDFGRFHATPKLLRSSLFPQTFDSIRDTDISRWLAECETAGLIAAYEVQGKTYLEITKFGQRMRSAKSKFPGRRTNDSGRQTSGSGPPSNGSGSPLYSESETESYSEAQTKPPPPTPQGGSGDGDVLEILSKRLRDLGIRDFDSGAKRAIKLRPPDVVHATIDFFLENYRLSDGTLAYDSGLKYLHWRICDSGCAENNPAQGWMEPDNPEFTIRKQRQAEEARRLSERSEQLERDRRFADPSPLEQAHGAEVDSLTWDQAIALLPDGIPKLTAIKRKRQGGLDPPGKTPFLRTALLTALSTPQTTRTT